MEELTALLQGANSALVVKYADKKKKRPQAQWGQQQWGGAYGGYGAYGMQQHQVYSRSRSMCERSLSTHGRLRASQMGMGMYGQMQGGMGMYAGYQQVSVATGALGSQTRTSLLVCLGGTAIGCLSPVWRRYATTTTSGQR